MAILAVSVRRGSSTTIRPPRCLDRLGPAGEVGRGHQRAVGGHRVGAEHQEVRRTVEVGDRQQQLVAEQLPRHQLVRHLVDRRRAEPVAGAQRLHERHRVGRRAERVGVGVAEVDADRVAAVPVQRVGQPVGHEVERLVPADLLPVRRWSSLSNGPAGSAVAGGRGRRTRRRARRPWGRCSRATAGRPGCPRIPVTLPVGERQLEPADRLAQVARRQTGPGEARGGRGGSASCRGERTSPSLPHPRYDDSLTRTGSAGGGLRRATVRTIRPPGGPNRRDAPWDTDSVSSSWRSA